MLGKYQIVEEDPGRHYVVYYKDFGEICRKASLADAINYCLQDWSPLSIHEYRSA
jgi:hypothetical protein